MDTENIFKVLARADSGNLLDSANAKLQELVAAVRGNGAKGKLTLTITVKPWKGSDALEVGVDVQASVPGPPRGADLYFATEEGALSRKDPRQPELAGTNVEQIRK